MWECVGCVGWGWWWMVGGGGGRVGGGCGAGWGVGRKWVEFYPETLSQGCKGEPSYQSVRPMLVIMENIQARNFTGNSNLRGLPKVLDYANDTDLCRLHNGLHCLTLWAQTDTNKPAQPHTLEPSLRHYDAYHTIWYIFIFVYEMCHRFCFDFQYHTTTTTTPMSVCICRLCYINYTQWIKSIIL